MEDKNVLSEAEEAAVSGGSAASVKGSSHRCVSCGSENVTITLRRLRTGAKMVVGYCNDCGHSWSFPLPQ
ncbi:MAG: hypothetical protein IJ201_01625 [Solobacterium sp.]|nr:hypothetical protein [Solobacterium sp.]